MKKHTMKVVLVAAIFLSVLFVVVGIENKETRMVLFGDGLPDNAVASAVYKLIYDLGVGSLISIIFYMLLVQLPEAAKRRRIRRSLEREFVTFKQDCILTILSVIGGDTSLIDELTDQTYFLRYFKEPTSIPDQDRWHFFLNNLDQERLDYILKAVELFRQEVLSATSAVDINDDQAFDFFKRLIAEIHRVQDSTLDYDSLKQISVFLWSILSGFYRIKGYDEEDSITRMIRSI